MNDPQKPSALSDLKALGQDLANLDQHTPMQFAAWAVRLTKAAAKHAATRVVGLFRSKSEVN